MQKSHLKRITFESKNPCHGHRHGTEAMRGHQRHQRNEVLGKLSWRLGWFSCAKKYQKMPKMSSECPWNTMKWWWNNDVCRCFHTCSPCGLIFVKACEEHLGLNFACCADMKQEDWKDFLLASAGNGSARKDLEKLLQKPELVDSNFLDVRCKAFRVFLLFCSEVFILLSWTAKQIIRHVLLFILLHSVQSFPWPRHYQSCTSRLFGLWILSIGQIGTHPFTHHHLSRRTWCDHLSFCPSVKTSLQHYGCASRQMYFLRIH